MSGLNDFVGRATRRIACAAVATALLASASTLARAETRTLKFYHLHTHEKAEIAYKKDGKYLPDGLKKIDWILRDWRRKQPVKMDPHLLDLIWEAYQNSGSRAYINVICGYRAPATNSMLRSRTSGVAENSQHTRGKALDFYLPDVPLKKMREIGLKMQVGGVGYYPKSGSPFVHFDTGNVRHWPRMSRTELAAVFPNGKTLHVPSDGKPLPGYQQALAEYKARGGASAIQVASRGSSSGGSKTLLAMLLGGGDDEADDNAEAATEAAAPAKRPVATPRAPVQVAAATPAAKPVVPATGVALPMRDAFDTTVPSEAAPAETTQVASLDLRSVPIPHRAPVRQPEAVAAPTVQPDAVGTLVAALDREDLPVAAPVENGSKMAFAAIPTPSTRPRFETVLASAKPADDKPATLEDIIGGATSQSVTPSAVARPAVPTPAVVVASREPEPAPAVVASRPALAPAAKTMPALKTVATLSHSAGAPSAKGGRLPFEKLATAASHAANAKRGATVTAEQPAGKSDRVRSVAPKAAASVARPARSQEAIGKQIELAFLVTAPDADAVEAMGRTSAPTQGVAPSASGEMGFQSSRDGRRASKEGGSPFVVLTSASAD
ncbi:DUF882 domain-containing protein [Consotaella salsifontis]|uniref:Murein endopeptidase K n=1 Tax=Consotaella salsifontis TaxID=1365950 RepID=A0A1T4R8Q8_9HYPH|nr:DUF882 domain-containing protein [Consotaella salsifontis]SKA12206.1 Uncharacterized conserved protein YcbK, DUF882 family [Consotaella salsifontis]